jgi:hypothetical protein
VRLPTFVSTPANKPNSKKIAVMHSKFVINVGGTKLPGQYKVIMQVNGRRFKRFRITMPHGSVVFQKYVGKRRSPYWRIFDKQSHIPQNAIDDFKEQLEEYLLRMNG